jgi:sulfatase maturation enzyme AslB (radical SAM superfamily)
VQHRIRIQVSIDGGPNEHNRFRILKGGEPTFDKIHHSLEGCFGEHRDLVTIRATMTKGNLNARRVFEAIEGLGWPRPIVAHANGNYEASRYTEDDLGQLREGYSALAEMYLERAVAREMLATCRNSTAQSSLFA